MDVSGSSPEKKDIFECMKKNTDRLIAEGLQPLEKCQFVCS